MVLRPDDAQGSSMSDALQVRRCANSISIFFRSRHETK